MASDTPTDELRRAYRAELRRRSQQAATTACWLSITLVPCFGLLDGLVFPDRAWEFAALRAACVAAIGGVLWLLRRPLGRRRPDLLALAVAALIIVMTDVMIARTGGIASRYWDGLSLVLLGVTVLMPWGAHWTVAATAIAIVSYAATVALAGPTPRLPDLANNLYFLGSTGIIATVGSLRASRLQWREFVQRAAQEEALRHRSDFMAKMSHELRTPLHAIVGYSDILLEGSIEADEDRRLVERIRSRGVFLHRMISDLLDYAKAEAGKMQLRRDPIHVADVVEQSVASFRPLVVRKGLDLEVRIAEELPVIACDAHRLEQIVTNLLANAVKFTERGGLTVEARLADRLSGFSELGAAGASAEPPVVAILITDTGVGIRDDDLRQLASDFQQLDGASDRFGGTGLGLSISRRLVDLLGGRLLVRSRPGAGSTFAILLPAGTVDRVEVARDRAA